MFSPLLPASFPPQNTDDRAVLLDWIRGVSLVYGPWQTFKRLFKDAEAAYSNGQRETEIFAALLARIDNATFIDEGGAGRHAPPIAPGNLLSIQVAHNLLYAIEGRDDLVVFDLASPLEPQEIFRYAPPASQQGYGSGCWIEDGHLIYGNASQLRVFELADPRNPKLLFSGNLKATGQVTAQGNLVFVADHQSLRVFSWTPGASAFTELGHTSAGYPYSLSAKPGLVGLSHWDIQRRKYSLTFFDVTYPSAPTQVSQIDANNPSHWEFQGDTLMLISGNDIIFYDFANSKNPRQISKLRINGARAFHVSGDRMYVSSYHWHSSGGRYVYEYKIRIVDISQLHSPRIIGEYDSETTQLAAFDNLLYIISNGLKALDVSEASRIQPVGQRPKNATFGYLKRRGRRFLRILADADPAAFTDLASAFLVEAGKNQDAIDLASTWTQAELTLGGGKRWKQSSHGRGAYSKITPDFVLKTREERAPQNWDNRLEKVRELWDHPHLPWQTQEMALKIMWAHGEKPIPSQVQIRRFLWSDSPALLKFAARHALSNLTGLDAEAYAPLIWVSNPRQRREILTFVDSKPESKSQVATYLAQILGLNAKGGLTRRAREIALLMAARFDLSDPAFKSDGALPIVPLLIASVEAPLRTLGLNLCRRLSPILAIQTLAQLETVLPAYREEFIHSLCESASGGPLTAEAIDAIIRHSEISIREAAWRLIAASQTSSEVLQAVWTKLFTGLRRESVYEGERYYSRYIGERWTESTALQTAVNSDEALLTLGRSGLQSLNVLPKFNAGLYAQAQYAISPSAWGAFSLILPPAAVIEVVLNAPGWNLNDGAWRKAWVRANAPHVEKLAAFWNAVQAFLDSDSPASQKELLQGRTFEQGDVAATFGGAASRLSPTLLMSLIGAVPENLWAQWRETLLGTLKSDSVTREAFWDAARRSPALEGGFLRARLLEDPDFAATFGLLESDALEADNPAFAPLILAWLRERESSLPRSSWIDAAIHPVPEVRDFALQHLQTTGLDVPGALRLLESKLPPSIRFGQDWFTHRGENHLESALVLADSPQLSVRAFGREFIAAQFETLMEAGLLEYLQENPNAEMQAFVAAQLTTRPDLAVPEFDRAVLRSRHRARHAKTLIHERTTQGAPLADERTLLEIARGRTPRDAEWALTQLARRALNGAPVEGVEVGAKMEA